MTGIFSKISKHQVSAPLKGITKSKGCYECKLYKKCNSPMMKYYGKGKKKILIIGEAPGEQEDRRGIPFVGDSGSRLETELYYCGIDIDEDCWRINAVNCRPTKDGKNRKPSSLEVEACRRHWKQAVHQLKPEKIILLGLTAITSFLGDRFSDIGKIERWLGWKIPDQTYGCWVYPTYHPNYVISNPKNKALKDYFTIHIAEAIEHDEEFILLEKNIQILTNEVKILKLLKKLVDNPPEYLAFDYETSGLKPYREGHYIRTVSLSFSRGHAVSFPFLSKNKKFLSRWKKIMRGPSKKVCQNFAMEAVWTEVICGYAIRNFAFDTMLAAHILDNRKHITGLKFQSYVRYGVQDYSREIVHYLVSKTKGSHEFNSIDKAPLKKLLKYGGYDSLLTRMLLDDQTRELTKLDLDEQYDFFHDGLLACYYASRNGMRIDRVYFEELNKQLEKEIKELERKILDTKEHKDWKKVKGNNLDISSSSEVKKLVVDVLKIKTSKKTKNNNISIDKEVLEKLKKKYKIFEYILEWRKKEKINSTYVLGFLREAVGDMTHPNINLHLVRTYRSSVDSPNMQNIPKRDEQAKKLVRTGIIPSPGNKLMAVDYSGAEIRSGCVYHNDSTMLDYVIHGKGDMHKEYAAKLYLIPIKWVSDEIKYEGKNGFIFPQFYGDWYVANAKQLWPASKRLILPSGKTVRKHLKEKRITTKYKYEDHVKEIERQFWEETFSEFNEWKEEAWEEYLKKGYVKMYTGFRCSGVMDRKNVVNYPFQGTAFHWLLWSMIEVVSKMIKAKKYKSRVIMQIHDELVIDLYPPEEEEIYKLIRKIMTKDIRKHWKWINIPLDVEAKVSKIDGNWYDMKVIKY